MKNTLGSLIIGWMVLTAMPAQAHAGWFTCENGSWQWSWKMWEWGCQCNSSWETTPSFWIDQCTTYKHPSCNNHYNQNEYICTFSNSETSSYLKCDENDPNLSSKCWNYQPYNTPFNFSSPGDDWFYKGCPRTHVCSSEPFVYSSNGGNNPCADLEFVTNSASDRPCGSGGIEDYYQ